MASDNVQPIRSGLLFIYDLPESHTKLKYLNYLGYPYKFELKFPVQKIEIPTPSSSH